MTHRKIARAESELESQISKDEYYCILGCDAVHFWSITLRKHRPSNLQSRKISTSLVVDTSEKLYDLPAGPLSRYGSATGLSKQTRYLIAATLLLY